MNVIKVEKLSKTFKTLVKTSFIRDIFRPQYKLTEAVQNISFSIKKGESVAFLGPNGAGKTTTIKMLTGLMYPSSGDIDVLGFKPFDRDKKYLQQIGLVMGNKAGLHWDLTPHQNFNLLRQIYKIEKKDFIQRTEELTKLLGIDKFLDTQVRKLSLGERMKMEIVGSIIHQPKVLFLDEPTIGLDILSRQRIRKFLRTIQKELKVTLLITSHNMDDVEKISDRIIVINKGKIIYDDALVKLISQYKKRRYIKFIFKEMPAVKQLPKIGKVIKKGNNYYLFEVENIKMSELIKQIITTFELIDIDIMSLPLEEIISDIFEKGS